MLIMALETATEACSAAVWRNGSIAERYRLAPREHNRLILPMIEEVLAEAGVTLSELDAVAFGRGPGSFTGVRIAAAVAQGIAFGADLPVVPVSTLAALALEAFRCHPEANWACPCIDARMGEVYCAAYRRGESGLPLLVGDEWVSPPHSALAVGRPSEPAIGIGSGWHTYPELLRERVGPGLVAILDDHFPRAAHVARLGADGFARGEAVPAHFALPVYLRDNVAAKPKRAPSPKG